MGAVLGALAGLGYGYAYRVLDTQHFGPPQRRARVFIVGHLGGFCPPEVLFEPESLPWHPAPGREAGEGTAGGAAGGAGETGGDVRWPADKSSTLDAAYATKQELGDQHVNQGCPRFVSVTGQQAHTLRAEGSDASEDGTGRGTPIVAPLPFDTTQITSRLNYSRPQRGDPCHPLAAGALSDQGAAVYPTLRSNPRDNSDPMAEAKMLVRGMAIRGRDGGAQVELRGDDVVNAVRAATGSASRGGAWSRRCPTPAYAP